MKKIMFMAVASMLALASCDEDLENPFNLDPVDPDQTQDGSALVGDVAKLGWKTANLGEFSVYTEKGQGWDLGKTYAKATGYTAEKTYVESTSWLISPAIDTKAESGKAYFTCKYVINYGTKLLDNHKVYVTKALAADTVSTQWVELPFQFESNSSTLWTFDREIALAFPAEFVNVEGVRVAFWFTSPADNSSTWELEDFALVDGDLDQRPAGADISNTPESAYTVTKAFELIEAGESLATKVYVKGTIKGEPNIETQYGNATYVITDGTNDIEIYRGYGLNNEKFTSTTALKEGDEVVVFGQLTLYNKKQQIASSYIYSLNGLTSKPEQTEFEVISLAEFLSRKDTDTAYEITGIAKGLNANYASLDLVDGDAKVYIYKMVDDKGEKVSFDALNLTEGDTVTVRGVYLPYTDKNGNVKDEINPATYVSHKKGGNVNPDPDPSNIDHISIAEFLQKQDTETTYELTGTVKNIANTTYGNFDLEEDGASIYIYGLLTKDGASKQFASLGIKEGDTLTLTGKYVDYNGKAEIKDAKYVSHISANPNPDPNPDPNPNPNPNPDPTPSGENLIVNGDFEAWDGNVPTNWKTASSAGNATLAQSTDAHGGSFSVQVNGKASNCRLAYKETTFDAGTYVVTFYVKSLGGATSEFGAQCRPGYATFNADGTINSNGYKYGEYATITESDWTLVTYEFTLDAAQQICPVVMNPKNCGNMLIDDYSLIKK
ncbi:MAG: hypothetical protein KBT20_08990 [Bacteroidales bacterium]|nr:hypothetical protein [Candidatus Liminaster caballi]